MKRTHGTKTKNHSMNHHGTAIPTKRKTKTRQERREESNEKDIHIVKIQRYYRGYKERQYVYIYLTIRITAASRIQALWKGLQARRQYIIIRKEAMNAIRIIHRTVRHYLRKTRRQRLQKYTGIATIIQRYYRKKRIKWRERDRKLREYRENILFPMATRIKMAFRRHLLEKRISYRRHRNYLNQVLSPASVTIQRVYRGYSVRKTWRGRLKESHASKQIQRWWSQNRKVQQMAAGIDRRRKNRMATKINKVARGHLQREIVRRKKEKKRIQELVNLSAIKIQRCYHQYRRRIVARNIQLRKRSVHTIEAFWKRRCNATAKKGEQEAMERQRLDMYAIKIQCVTRRYFAIKQADIRRLILFGKKLKSARCIQRAFLNYREMKNLRENIRRMQVEKKLSAFAFLQDERTAVENDIQDVKVELQHIRKCRLKSREGMKELSNLRKTFELRLPDVIHHLEHHETQDETEGWVEAWEREKSMIIETLPMIEEDIHGKQLRCNDYSLWETYLMIDLEDLDIDLDEIERKELQEVEATRQMEIERGLFFCKQNTLRNVRKQKIRWKYQETKKRPKIHSRKEIATNVERNANLLVSKYGTTYEQFTDVPNRVISEEFHDASVLHFNKRLSGK